MSWALNVVQESGCSISCSSGVLRRPEILLILTWTSKLMVTSSSSLNVSSRARSYKSANFTCVFMLVATPHESYLFVNGNVSVTL